MTKQLDPEAVDRMCSMIERKQIKPAMTAQRFGVARDTVYKHLRKWRARRNGDGETKQDGLRAGNA